MNTFTITSIPYYNSYSQCYLNVLSINIEPQGPLKRFVRRINFPKLSSYKISSSCNPINNCGLVLTNFTINNSINCCSNSYNYNYNSKNYSNDLLTPNNIPELISFLLSNGYQIETQITNNLFGNLGMNVNGQEIKLTDILKIDIGALNNLNMLNKFEKNNK